MTSATLSEVLSSLRRLTDAHGLRELPDGELLERFVARRDETAFATLMRRHGPMVWCVCCRLLHDPHRAEDAFQATFLVLVRKAGSIRKRASLGSWLHGIAYRVAIKSRTQVATVRAQERRFSEMPRSDPVDEMTWLELRAVLDEELSELPDKYRAPIVLCYLEGQTQNEAARQLGCPRTSLSSRLDRGRALLHERLVRRGLILSAGLLSTLLAEKALASSLPVSVMLSALQATAATTVVSPQVLALSQGVLKTMSTIKVSSILALVFLLSGIGALGLADNPAAPFPAEKRTKPAADAPAVKEHPPLFRDVTAESGIDFTYRNGEEADQFTPLESIGGGVALIDYDGDGLLDIFLPGGGYFAGDDKTTIKGHPCKLYKNLGKGKFKDVTKDVGLDRIDFYTHGAAVVDYDADGWPDLLVTGYGQLALFHNESDGKKGRKFVDVTRKAGLTDELWSISAVFADFDGDGYPDLYVCHYHNWSFKNHPKCIYDGKSRDICPPKSFEAQPHKLYRNNGDGTFTDVSKEAGLRSDGKGLGVIAVDVDDDGKPDIFVANDTTDQFLYRNRCSKGKFRFDEIALQAGVARNELGATISGKSVAAADYDNSGRPSLFVPGYQDEVASLFRNAGGLHFVSGARTAGLARLGQNSVGWGVGFVDFDQDGWPDLFIANGHVLRSPPGKCPIAQLPTLLRNKGGKFIDITEQGGPYFRKCHRARGVAIGDLDNDGQIDLIISHLNEPVTILRNEARTEGNHWLGVELEGKNRRDVSGARVVLEIEDQPKQSRFAGGGGSFASSSDPRFVFGIGSAKRIGKLTVRWPSGKEQSWDGLAIDRYWRLVEGEKDAQEGRK
jgi:RNA polymerase sigma factor (sigma-70 family)